MARRNRWLERVVAELLPDGTTVASGTVSGMGVTP